MEGPCRTPIPGTRYSASKSFWTQSCVWSSSAPELRAAAESYCVDTCRAEGRCPIERALPKKADCPLFKYTQALTAAIVPESLT